MKSLGIALSVFALCAGSAHAGPYSDDLGKCMVESTTAADKNELVKWMFATAALHPAVQSISSVSDAERTQSNRSTAKLFEKLLTETCRSQMQQAMKYEGAVAVQTGFRMLGEVAARELFADPSVAAGMADLERHFDKQKLVQALTSAK